MSRFLNYPKVLSLNGYLYLRCPTWPGGRSQGGSHQQFCSRVDKDDFEDY